MAIDLPMIPFAGVVIDFVAGVAGMMILLTGLVAGGFRAFAILGRSSPERCEWFTALGFVWGMTAALTIFALDVVVG